MDTKDLPPTIVEKVAVDGGARMHIIIRTLHEVVAQGTVVNSEEEIKGWVEAHRPIVTERLHAIYSRTTIPLKRFLP